MRAFKPTRWIAVAAVVLVVVALSGWRMLGSGSDGVEFAADFDSAVGLYPGSDVEMLGVPVGHVTKVQPRDGKVHVRMQLDSGQNAEAGTAAVIIAPTLVSDRYVQLTAPYDGHGAKLASGAVIPVDRTAVPVEIDQLYKNLDQVFQTLGPNGANAHGALSKLLKVAAKNLRGQGHHLHTTITQFGKASATLNHSADDLFATVGHLQSFTSMLRANDSQVAHLNSQLANVSSYLAEDRDDMAAAVDNLGGALKIVTDFIRDNRAHLRSSVQRLTGPTKVLVRQKKSLREAIKLIPLALQNYVNAYNPGTNTIDGRGDLNELTIWAGSGGNTARTSASSPPTMFDGSGGQ